MTVGIASIAENGGDPAVVVAADRLVTVGNRDQSRVEYEDTNTKIEPVIHESDLTAMVVGAGNTTVIDEVVNTIPDFMPHVSLNGTRDAKHLVKLAYQDVMRRTIDDNVFSPLGYSISDLKDAEGDDGAGEDFTIPDRLQSELIERAHSFRNHFADNVRLLLASVDENGADIHQIAGGNANRFTGMGYAVVGSGTESARLTFIRRNYDSGCSLRESVFTTLEAKLQAEERQGVGNRMDLAHAKPGHFVEYDNSEIRELRDLYQRVTEREREARENVMDEWDSP